MAAAAQQQAIRGRPSTAATAVLQMMYVIAASLDTCAAAPGVTAPDRGAHSLDRPREGGTLIALQDHVRNRFRDGPGARHRSAPPGPPRPGGEPPGRAARRLLR